MQSQIHCALIYAKANNRIMADMSERISKVESRMGTEANLINPLQNSEIPPALEVEEELKNN